MLPALNAFADGRERRLSEVREWVAVSAGLSADDVREMLPSGRQAVFANRVGWAVTYMERAGLLERIRRGVYQLTQEGERMLSRKPSRIDMNLLGEYPDFAEWSQGTKTSLTGKDPAFKQNEYVSDTPEEALDRAARQLSAALEADVLGRVRDAAPAFLERVVVDLLIAMGYGGGDATMGRVTGCSGDGGIDGTIREDALGLDEVYVQAKKYAEDNAVGEGDLRNFAGALDAAGTVKGVFVTTARFTRAAKDYVARSPKRIVLIDGTELARLMVRNWGTNAHTSRDQADRRGLLQSGRVVAPRLPWNEARPRAFASPEDWKDAACEKGEMQRRRTPTTSSSTCSERSSGMSPATST